MSRRTTWTWRARNWLEDYLHDYPNAFILISHDRYFLDVTVNKTVEVWNKRMHVYHGNYEKYVMQKEERRTQLMSAYKNQRDRIEALEAFINRFRAQATKAKQVQSRIKELEKIERIEVPEEEATIHFTFPQPPASGRTVIEVSHLTKNYPMPDGGTKRVLEDVSFTIERGDRIALVGANGAGKSTLIRMLSGLEEPTSRRDQAGAQRAGGLLCAGPVQGAGSGNAKMLDDITGSNPKVDVVTLRSLLGCFMFSGDDVFKKLGVLSRRGAQPVCDGEDAGVARRTCCCWMSRRTTWICGRRMCCWRRFASFTRDGAVCVARPLLYRWAGDAGVRGGGPAGAYLSGELRGLSVAQGWRAGEDFGGFEFGAEGGAGGGGGCAGG